MVGSTVVHFAAHRVVVAVVTVAISGVVAVQTVTAAIIAVVEAIVVAKAVAGTVVCSGADRENISVSKLMFHCHTTDTSIKTLH